MRSHLTFFLALLFSLRPVAADTALLTLETSAAPGKSTANAPLSHNIPDATAFRLEAEIDPSLAEGGNSQAVAAIVLSDSRTLPDPRSTTTKQLAIEFREGGPRGLWEIWIDGAGVLNVVPEPRPAGWVDNNQYQQPHIFLQRDGAYRFALTATPRDGTTTLRFYLEHLDRPVFETQVARVITPQNAFFHTRFAGENKAALDSFLLQEIDPATALESPPPWEIVLRALDYSRPELKPVAVAIESRDFGSARDLFLRHMRTRNAPRGPGIEEVEIHPDYRTIARENLAGRYGNLGWFSEFAEFWTDANGETHQRIHPDGTINWSRENGHLNRHFHWLALARTWAETGEDSYAKLFAHEVTDWVTREPFYWDACPQIGGLNTMDGTLFRFGYMNTSNIGRRCELTWWPAYEVFRKAIPFDEDAHFAMLLGFLRQSRLLMNPTSFAAHDDGGSHGAMALLKNGVMLPEFKESASWRAEALRRWDEILKVQFYADGSHCSLSTGYNWASLGSLEKFIGFMKLQGVTVPEKFLTTMEHAYSHPVGLSRPDQGQIDLNDGGWGMIDTNMQRALELFPHREDFRWMVTKKQEGRPPDYTSIYYPNAGHFVLRNGWGEADRYLFMDAGPFGASHGKNDKLTLYLALGPHQLLANGGRGTYDRNDYSLYANHSRSHNAILIDDLPQGRVHLKNTHFGYTPEERRFVTNGNFDYAEGFYRSGWHGSEKNVQGLHTRQLLMIKGSNPPATSYFVVIDTVAPADEEAHEYRALFHSRRDHVEMDEATLTFEGHDHGAAFKIIPADTRDLVLEDIYGQTEPYFQGWHVVGPHHKPMHTARYLWRAKGPTTRAWLLVPAEADRQYCVESVKLTKNENGNLLFEVALPDGARDLILRRDPTTTTPTELHGATIIGDIAVLSLDKDGELKATLNLKNIPGKN